MLYVMSDLHGYYDKFLLMLEKINFAKEDTLVVAGDVIDRGRHSIKMLKFIMCQNNIKLMLGNHEDMMLQSLIYSNRSYYRCWMNNGGIETLRDFDKLTAKSQIDILDFLYNCPLKLILQNKYIIVHAGIETLDSEERDILLWEEGFFKEKGIDNYTVVFGHTPTNLIYQYFNNKIKTPVIWHDDKYKDKIGIDCGVCFNGGQLGCLRLDDMEEFYIK